MEEGLEEKNVLKYWKLVKYYGLYCEPAGYSRPSKWMFIIQFIESSR